MSLDVILQGGLALIIGVIVYWVKRQDARSDTFDVRMDDMERVMHTQYISQERYTRESSELKADYRREQDSASERLVRIEAKLDRLIEGTKGKL